MTKPHINNGIPNILLDCCLDCCADPVYLGGEEKKKSTFELLWQLLIFSTSDNSHNESQQTGALNSVSPYIISAIHSTEAVAMRLRCHLRVWNVILIHSHYLPELIGEPLVHINQKITKENVTIGPRRTSSWFQLTSLPLFESYLWGVMRGSRSRAGEKKKKKKENDWICDAAAGCKAVLLHHGTCHFVSDGAAGLHSHFAQESWRSSALTFLLWPLRRRWRLSSAFHWV